MYGFDIKAMSCGSLFAVQVAAGMVTESGPKTRVLAVGADRHSGIMDGADARTRALFGAGDDRFRT
ncbi:hypothetical protein [Paenibacillus borealis]|uniref:Beta-ketoacyl-[acyl-carrier-protein] synthase III N-terminal domain-containing protein n=1 Tax=Paenibacillus borealis TaxID=160799 RepID=A0ABX3H9V0_PAEBO|nr:hypothetical protein BSK56_13750 [Paenibacillus borealis]